MVDAVPFTRFAAVTATLIAMLAVLTVAAGPASAHAVLVKSDPADGQRVAGSPDRVTLTFSDRLTRIGTTVRVTGPGGDAAEGKPSIQGDTITQALRPDLPAGTYEVRWQVASGDGHPVSKAFSFVVAQSSAAPPAPSAVAPPITKTPQATPPATVRAVFGRQAGTDTGQDVGASRAVWIALLLALVAGAAVAAWALFRRAR